RQTQLLARGVGDYELCRCIFQPRPGSICRQHTLTEFADESASSDSGHDFTSSIWNRAACEFLLAVFSGTPDIPVAALDRWASRIGAIKGQLRFRPAPDADIMSLFARDGPALI